MIMQLHLPHLECMIIVTGKLSLSSLMIVRLGF